MAKIWLITGSGNGLGRNIVEAALAAGDSVVAGASQTEELVPLVERYGRRLKPVRLDVRDEATAKAAVQLAVDTFGSAGRVGQQCRLRNVRAIRADERGGLPILGVDAEKWVQRAKAARASEAEKFRHLTVSNVFDDAESISELPNR